MADAFAEQDGAFMEVPEEGKPSSRVSAGWERLSFEFRELRRLARYETEGLFHQLEGDDAPAPSATRTILANTVFESGTPRRLGFIDTSGIEIYAARIKLDMHEGEEAHVEALVLAEVGAG